MFCPHCGIRLAEETNNFCPHCGKRLLRVEGPLFPAPKPFIDPDDSAAMEAVVKEGVVLPTPIPAAVPVIPTPSARPEVTASAPVRSRHCATSGPMALLLVVGCLLLLGAWVLLWVAPLVEAPYVADTGGALMAAVAELDPALAASITMERGASGASYTLVELLTTALAYGDALGNTSRGTLVLGVALSCVALVVVALLLGFAGLLSALVRRRSTGLMVAGAVMLFALVLAGAGAVGIGDLMVSGDLHTAATALVAGEGPRVVIPSHGLVPTPFLLGALGASLLSMTLVMVVRHRGGTERSYVV